MKSMKKMNRDIRSHFLRITEIQDEHILNWAFNSGDEIWCKSLSLSKFKEVEVNKVTRTSCI